MPLIRLAPSHWGHLLTLLAAGLLWTWPLAPAHAAQLGLVIGIDHYQHGADSPREGQVKNLQGAVNDARLLRDALRGVGVEIPESRVLLDGAATRAGVLAAWHGLVAAARPGDTLVLAYSGHGGQEKELSAPRDEDDGLDETLMLADFDPNEPLLGRLSDDELIGLFKAASAFKILFIADTCHAAGLNKNWGSGRSRASVAPNGEPWPVSSGARRPSEVVPTAADDAPLPHVTQVLANDAESQEINELEIGGATHGALSWSLTQVLSRAAAPWSDDTLTREELAIALEQGVRAATKNRQTPRLLPVRDATPVLSVAEPSATPAAIPQRVALVIGNGAYDSRSGWKPLRNPPNDAVAVAAKLRSRRLHFDQVIQQSNLDQQGLVRALEAFEAALRPGDTAFFFYSGHGAQAQGQNYLVATDAGEPTTLAALQRGSLPVNDVFAVLRERKTALNVIVLDACRDDPIGGGTKGFGTRGIEAGLAGEMLAPAGFVGKTLIGYATAAGDRALDGLGKLSPYTAALVAELDRPGDLHDTFKRINQRVADATHGRQMAWIKTETPGAVILVEPTLVPPSWWLWVFLVGLVLPSLGLLYWRRESLGLRLDVLSATRVRGAAPPEPPRPAPSVTEPPRLRYRLVDHEDASQGFDFPDGTQAPMTERILGSGADADWQIGLDTISWHHARFFWREAAWWIEDLDSSNGTRVNGERLGPHTARRLQPNDAVTFAEHVMRIDGQCPAESAIPAPPGPDAKAVEHGANRPSPSPTSDEPRCRLTDVMDPSVGFDFPNTGRDRSPSLIIGRESPADWLIPLGSISARHAGIFWQSGAWWIKDLDSTNGTRLNGERLEPHQVRRLAPGDQIGFAEVVLRFECLATTPQTS